MSEIEELARFLFETESWHESYESMTKEVKARLKAQAEYLIGKGYTRPLSKAAPAETGVGGGSKSTDILNLDKARERIEQEIDDVLHEGTPVDDDSPEAQAYKCGYRDGKSVTPSPLLPLDESKLEAIFTGSLIERIEEPSPKGTWISYRYTLSPVSFKNGVLNFVAKFGSSTAPEKLPLPNDLTLEQENLQVASLTFDLEENCGVPKDRSALIAEVLVLMGYRYGRPSVSEERSKAFYQGYAPGKTSMNLEAVADKLSQPTLFTILVQFMHNVKFAEEKQKQSGVYADYKVSDAIATCEKEIEAIFAEKLK
jgi:hypothetical protein